MCIPKEIEQDWHEYNKLKHSGLKKQANKLLLSIVEKIENQGLLKFKNFLFSLCEEGLSSDYTKKIQHPIFVRCVLPLLVDGYNSNSVQELVFIVKANINGYCREIFQSIGQVSNQELLKTALLAEPNNRMIISLLAADYVEGLYYGAHHLPDCLIIEQEYANSLIKESSLFFEQHSDLIEIKLIDSHKYYLQLYHDYLVWKTGLFKFSFQEWCEKNNRTYHWVKSFCYD